LRSALLSAIRIGWSFGSIRFHINPISPWSQELCWDFQGGNTWRSN
jgi:hypothetical protein